VNGPIALDFKLVWAAGFLRQLGCNVWVFDYGGQNATGEASQASIFERCRRERRFLVTTSRRLVQRRECPPFACIPHVVRRGDWGAVCAHIKAQGFALEFCEELFTRLCGNCGAEVREVSKAEAATLPYVAPMWLEEDSQVRMTMCDPCNRLRYWTPEKYKRRMEDVLKTMQVDGKEEDRRHPAQVAVVDPELAIEGLGHADEAKSEPGEGAPRDLEEPDVNVVVHVNAELQLAPPVGVWCTCPQSRELELEWTNWAGTFKDTLDYIFCNAHHVDNDHATTSTEVVGARIGEHVWGGACVWPSDHRLVRTVLEFGVDR
jgi:uncharacterized protein with PIN domain